MTELEHLLARKAEAMQAAAMLQLAADGLERDARAFGQMLRQYRLDNDLLPPREAQFTAPDRHSASGLRVVGQTARHDGTD